jgi:hypothetical protein
LMLAHDFVRMLPYARCSTEAHRRASKGLRRGEKSSPNFLDHAHAKELSSVDARKLLTHYMTQIIFRWAPPRPSAIVSL